MEVHKNLTSKVAHTLALHQRSSVTVATRSTSWLRCVQLSVLLFVVNIRHRLGSRTDSPRAQHVHLIALVLIANVAAFCFCPGVCCYHYESCLHFASSCLSRYIV